MDEKFCLKWNDFDENIRDYFRTLRKDQRLFDVTLATDDGQQVQAHKIILSAGSHFFSDIFQKCNHANMLIYLKGIRSADLEHVTDFMYNGEASISQVEIKEFLETGKELRVKGLLSELQGVGVQEKVSDEQLYSELTEAEHLNDENLEDFHHPIEDIQNGSVSEVVNNELDRQVEEMIEKSEGLWKCKVCGKTTKSAKKNMRRHVEIHVEGVSHPCHLCSKTFRTRHYLQNHVSKIHSESLSCNICGKSGMTRSLYYKHKQKCQ